MAKIVIDPITRIEGHLRIEAEINGGRVQRCLEQQHHVPRHREYPPGQGPARRLVLRPEVLRGVHHRPFHRLHPQRGKCTGDKGPGKRGTDQEPDHRHPERPGPCDPFLPSARPRLGGHHLRAESGSGQDRGPGRLHFRLAAQFADLLQRCAGQAEGVRQPREDWAPSPTPTGVIPRTSSLPKRT